MSILTKVWHMNVYKEDKHWYFSQWMHTNTLNIFWNIKIPFEKKIKFILENVKYH
jgi:hypothetical protein